MKQEKIKTIIKKELKHIAHLCEEINNSFNMDVIHDFRTTVKSLRSFLRLQHTHTHDTGIKMTKKFKRLYHIAGIIRELQLETEHFRKIKTTLPHYLAQLHQTLALQKKEWKTHYSEKILQKLRSKLTGFKYKTLAPAILAKFFNDRMNVIDRITNKRSPTDTQVHTARKRIKDILYNINLARKKWKDVQLQINDATIKQLDTLAAMLGDYNDARVMLEHLIICSSQNMEHDEHRRLKRLINKETKKLQAMKKSAVSAMKNHLEPV